MTLSVEEMKTIVSLGVIKLVAKLKHCYGLMPSAIRAAFAFVTGD
jgi:hypothetical protein